MIVRLVTALTFAAAAGAAQPLIEAERTLEERKAASPLVETERTLDELKWVARPIVVFADSPRDPRVLSQLQAFEEQTDELLERDVVILIDTDPDGGSELRTRFRPRSDFMAVLMGKDGEVKYRKPRPVTVRELMRLIDRMPMRRQEMLTRRDDS